MDFKKLKSPNTFVLIGSLLIITAALTWIIPGGEFERETVNGREVVKEGSFRYTDSNPQSIDDLLFAPIRGFERAAEIIAFIFIVGGAFGVFQKTEAVNAAIIGITKAHNKSKLLQKILLPLLISVFSLAGAVFGMSEEVIPFVLLFIPLALMLGYDTITGVAIPFVGAGAGFAGAFINPFTIGIAQGIAGLPPLSGIEYRIAVWIIITGAAILFITRYARKVKANPHLSIIYDIDNEKRKKINLSDFEAHGGLTGTHKSVLVIFMLGMLVLVFGVLYFKWYIEEIAALFMILGITVGLFGRLSVTEIINSFINGAKELISTAFVIALAWSIQLIARDGKIIDTILYELSSPISDVHPVISSQMMFVVQSLINFFVPSGSGQAALTMPIMAPLSDLVGVTRQTAVLAFQFGDGFSNMIIPTSAVTMGVLAVAGIPWEKWARWILPLELLFFILALLLLIPPYFMNW